RSISHALRQGWKITPDLRRIRYSVQSDQSADLDPTTFVADGVHPRKLLDVDHPLRRDQVIFHEGQQIGSAGKDLGVTPIRRQQAQRLLHRVRAHVLEAVHALSPFCAPPKAANTRAGVSGNMGTRTPMAFATALLMAAPGETTGGSPSPITPRLSYLFDIMCTTSSPISPMRASR